MPIKSNVPIRIGGSRVRTACTTCKKRHIKCDEGRPACSKCLRVNRLCSYGTFQTGVADANTIACYSNNIDSPNVPPKQRGLRYEPAPYNVSEWIEMNAIQHFARFLGKELAGSFSDLIWRSTMPLAAQHERAVWHGLVAVSALDTDLRRSHHDRAKSLDDFAIRHYSEAIRNLRLRLEGPEEQSREDVVLLCCVIFAVFECLQGHYSTALCHIGGGLKLLIGWGGEGKLDNRVGLGNYLNRTMLQSIFLSLDSQAIQLGAKSHQDFFSGPALEDRLGIADFETIDDAHLLLNQIFHRLSHWANWVEPVTATGTRPSETWVFTEGQRLKIQLLEWDASFRRSFRYELDTPALSLLLAQRKCIQAMLGKSVDGPSESEWDKYLPLFEEVLIHAEDYLKLTGNLNGANPMSNGGEPFNSKPVLTVTADIVMPLFLVSTRCRNTRVRRRALEMLRSCNRREGIWDSWQCAEFAERMIVVEEEATSVDGEVPESVRVGMIDVDFDEERKTVVDVCAERF